MQLNATAYHNKIEHFSRFLETFHVEKIYCFDIC